jgi:hypothetical protein
VVQGVNLAREALSVAEYLVNPNRRYATLDLLSPRILSERRFVSYQLLVDILHSRLSKRDRLDWDYV